MSEHDPDRLKLTDFMDLATLQEIQDSFAAVANVKARITDADGNLLTQPVPPSDFLARQQAIAEAAEATAQGPQREGAEYIAPIVVNNQRLGTIRMAANTGPIHFDEARLTALAEKLGIDFKQMKQAAGQIVRSRTAKPAAIQFLYLLANAIARLCYQEFQLRQRINELTAVYSVTMMLADAGNLNQILQRTVEVVANVMGMRSASLRLLDPDRDELIIKATYNLSPEYVHKGPIRLSHAPIDLEAMGGKGYDYVRDLRTDPRTLYPEEAKSEGIVSMLSAGLVYRGKPIGVIRVYTAQEQVFSQFQIDLLKAVAAQAAAAIENARLVEEESQAQALERQVQLAAQVQHRMIPRTPPIIAGIDLAAVYVPCYDLGGDFYDFIELPNENLGLAIADVSGKGIPASLTMAAVRAALRAQVDNVYYLYEAVRRINVMICRDSNIGEFVTLFYGVLDTRARRFTYCNCGHPPGLVLRDGKVIELESNNTVLGVSPDEIFAQTWFDLQSGDTLLLHTDGLMDAMNFENKTFTRQRVREAFAASNGSAESITQNVLWHMRRFVGLNKPTDDVTMIAAKIL